MADGESRGEWVLTDTYVSACIDLGPLPFFLGVEVLPNRSGMFLSQHKYIRDILI